MQMQKLKNLFQKGFRNGTTAFKGFNFRGEGTYSIVILTEMTLFNYNNQEVGKKNVAIKLLTPVKQGKLFYDFNKQQQIIQFQSSRYFREITNQKAKKNPHLMEILAYFYGYQDFSYYLFIVLPSCDSDLSRLTKQINVQKSEYIGLQQIIKILYHIALGLQCLHDANIAHRDLKPGNILIMKRQESQEHNIYIKRKNEQGYYQILIADFGLSKQLVDFKKSVNSTTAGTIRYTPPQMINSQQCDERCIDIWSFGIICLRILGRSPFETLKNFEFQKNAVDTKMRESYYNELKKLPKEKQKAILNMNKYKGKTQQQKQLFQTLISKCLQENFKNRCTSKELVEEFKKYFVKKKETSLQNPDEKFKAKIIQQTSHSKFYQIYKITYKICKQCLNINKYLYRTNVNAFHIKILMLLAFKEYINTYYDAFIDSSCTQEQIKLIKQDYKIINDPLIKKYQNYEYLVQQVIQILNCPENHVFKYFVEQLQNIYKLSADAVQIQRIMRKYLEIFHIEIQECSLAKTFLPLFYLIAYKSFIFQFLEVEKVQKFVVQLFGFYQNDLKQILDLQDKRKGVSLMDIRQFEESKKNKEEFQGQKEAQIKKQKENKCQEYLRAKSQFRYNGINQIQKMLKQVLGDRIDLDIVDVL